MRRGGELGASGLPAVAPPIEPAQLALAPVEEPLTRAASLPTSPEEVAQENPSPQTTAGVFLAGYYGDAWPEIEAKIKASKIMKVDLDMPYVFHPWEEAMPVLEKSIVLDDMQYIVDSRMDWPKDVTLEFIYSEFHLAQGKYDLSEADLLEIGAVVEPKHIELREAAQAYADRLDSTVKERWYTGNYVRAPFTTAGICEDTGFFSTSSGGLGWGVNITLKREDYPDLIEMRNRISALQDERDQLVLAYLRTKVKRGG